MGSAPGMRIVGVHHVAISTTDVARLRAFYVETLGLRELGGFPDQDIVFLGLDDDRGVAIEIVGEGTPGEPPAPGFERRGWQHLAWEVADLDAAYAELSARGVRFTLPPEGFPAEAPRLRVAFFEDPDGNLVELVQPLGRRYPPADAPTRS